MKFLLVPFIALGAASASYYESSPVDDVYDIHVPAGENSMLPDDGSVQALRMRGEGTQNYKCQKNDDGTYSWALQFPLAKLWLYDKCGHVDTSRHPDGMHYFANIGSGAGWDLGTNCNAGTNPDDRSCDSYSSRWRGKAPQADPQDKAISWLLVEKDEDNMSPVELEDKFYNEFWNYNWMQRLDTTGGLPTGTCDAHTEGRTVASYYECDYILGFTPIHYDDPGAVELPKGCFQALPLYGQGVQRYQYWDGNWILSEPIASLRSYSTKTHELIQGDKGLVGRHFFANVGGEGTAGSGAGWSVGFGCDLDDCEDQAGTWRGKSPITESNGPGNIALLLVTKDTDNIPKENNDLSEYDWMQRLTTKDGVPPATGAHQGDFFDSDYTCDYVLAYCVEDKHYDCKKEEPKKDPNPEEEKYPEKEDYHDPPECPDITKYIYYNQTDPSPSVFDLDKHCPDDETCVGTTFTFKHSIYLDKYLHYPAGFTLGHCIIVAEYPAEDHKPPVYKPYCLASVVVEYKEEIDWNPHYPYVCHYSAEVAVQGVGSLDGDFELFLTALAGDYEAAYKGGSLAVKPTEKYPEVLKGEFKFY